MTGGCVLEVEGLRARRGGARVLSVDRLSLAGGEVLSLVGPNGAGKTTLLLAFMGLVRLEAGTVRLDGRDAAGHGGTVKFRRRFAMVFQEPLLFRGTVRRNAAMGLSIQGAGRAETAERVARFLRLFGVEHLAAREARTLSGGEAQRVSLARAFAVGPRVLLMDEPFSSLDAPTRERLTDDLASVLAETGTAAVMATHDRADALALSDRIAVMRAGSVVQCGTPAELSAYPADGFVRSFMGDETVLRGEVTGVFDGSFAVNAGGATIEIAGSAISGERITFGVSPRNVVLSRAPTADTSARNSFRGKIVSVVTGDNDCRIVADLGFPLNAAITGRSMEHMGLAEGQDIHAFFKSTSVRIISRKRGPS